MFLDVIIEICRVKVIFAPKLQAAPLPICLCMMGPMWGDVGAQKFQWVGHNATDPTSNHGRSQGMQVGAGAPSRRKFILGELHLGEGQFVPK